MSEVTMGEGIRSRVVYAYRLLEAHMGIFFAVQLPQKDFIDLVVSSKIVVQCDMQTCMPHSAHLATACPLQTEHLAT
jgi:hypothetical protein